MITPGKYNILDVVKKTATGVFLSDGQEEVFLPANQVPDVTEVGNKLEVFVYTNNDDRIIPTTIKPHGIVGDFVFLMVKEVNEVGAFLDWGIGKDVLAHFRQQKTPMRIGNSYLVYLYMDEFTDRVVASSKWNKFIDNSNIDLHEEDEVQLLIAEKTDLGFKAIINNKYLGLLYKNEVFEPVQSGDKKRGYIKEIREDGKIDLSLQVKGFEHIEDAKYKILHQLELSSGSLLLGDKSSPEEIYRQLKISKKAFKKTIGSLYKDRLIEISDFEIHLKTSPKSKA